VFLVPVIVKFFQSEHVPVVSLLEGCFVHVLKSMKVDGGMGNVGRDRRISMTGSRDVEANGKSLRSLDVAGGTWAEGAGRSRDVECRKKHRRGKRHTDYLTPQFLIVIQKDYISNISRPEARLQGRN
jgi:hypothetical protein